MKVTDIVFCISFGSGAGVYLILWSLRLFFHVIYRRGLGLACMGGAIYAVGGLDDKNCFDTVERYDPVANTWTQVASLNLPRGGVGVAVLKVMPDQNPFFSIDFCCFFFCISPSSR